MIEIWPGDPYPLGATYDGAGTNFALFTEVAEKVELCLFDDDGVERDAFAGANYHNVADYKLFDRQQRGCTVAPDQRLVGAQFDIHRNAALLRDVFAQTAHVPQLQRL